MEGSIGQNIDNIKSLTTRNLNYGKGFQISNARVAYEVVLLEDCKSRFLLDFIGAKIQGECDTLSDFPKLSSRMSTEYLSLNRPKAQREIERLANARKRENARGSGKATLTSQACTLYVMLLLHNRTESEREREIETQKSECTTQHDSQPQSGVKCCGFC
ncbi:hypothetical protein VNO77_17010 [Canavalia gladiata]|uniref:Uncharacterized protein n=1 Tax=Canavalia gladiata TaxID=3824 RepID=A0AAN9QMB3_CANGL